MENCLEEAPHGSQDYYPHYNLFQSSIFYDTDNFRVSYLSYKYDDSDDCLPSESSTNEERSAEPPDKPPEPEPGAPRSSRVISKEDLYRDPDQFKSKFGDGQPTSNGIMSPAQTWGYDWTKQSWVKEGAPVVDVRDEGLEGGAEPDAGPRVTSSKAESMMQRMGWQGGALGKPGGGARPLTPDTVCAVRSGAGVGARTPPAPAHTQPRGAHAHAHNKRDVFRTNVLLHILEFVQDDTETELVFDASLRQYERRHMTHILSTVVGERRARELKAGPRGQYVLETARRGEGDKRQLCIYKEPPEDVYLITPEDFLPKDDIEEKTEYIKPEEPKTVENSMDIDDDENPFLKSIKKSIKKEEPISDKFETDCSIAKNESKDDGCKVENLSPEAKKMIEYFLEFAETEAFKELRFLGKFTAEQLAAINSLLNNVALWSAGPETSERFEGESEIARACRAAGCRLREGANGTAEIHKIPAKPRAKD